MTSAATNYHESTPFIHQRYEDTSLVIFQQQQKVRQDEKRRQKHTHQPSLPATQHPEFNRFGNHDVVETNIHTKPQTTTKPVSSPVKERRKSQETRQVQPDVKSSPDAVDEARPIRRRRPQSKTIYLIESSV